MDKAFAKQIQFLRDQINSIRSDANALRDRGIGKDRVQATALYDLANDICEVERFISYSESPTKEILTEINSNINNVLFGDSSLDFEGFYLYSIQKPIQSFFPITIINTNGAAGKQALLN